jgi:predicted PurR-regulated permease PerM
MSTSRPILFWIATVAAVVALAVLLREVLLPFVAGMVLAYLLDPLANRIERLGMNRLLATLSIIVFVVVALAILAVLTVPVIIRELSYFVDDLPLYVRRVHMLANDPGHPWLSKIIGEGLGETERSMGELTTFASGWFDTILRSVWSGGRALISILSLGIVAPTVACYLLYDWDKMVATIDNWIPPAHRQTVRALAREVDKTISEFVRGQSSPCLVLAVYYAVALRP